MSQNMFYTSNTNFACATYIAMSNRALFECSNIRILEYSTTALTTTLPWVYTKITIQVSHPSWGRILMIYAYIIPVLESSFCQFNRCRLHAASIFRFVYSIGRITINIMACRPAVSRCLNDSNELRVLNDCSVIVLLWVYQITCPLVRRVINVHRHW